MGFVSTRTGCVAALLAMSFGLAAWAAAPSAARKFTLIYNVNNAGYIDVCGCKHKEVRQGSITRRASFLKQIRATGRDILLLDGGSSFFPVDERVKDTERAEAIRRTRRYNLMSEARATQSIAFTDQYRSYVINYGLGRDLVARFVEWGGAPTARRWQTISRMLSEPFLPGDLQPALP